MLLSSQQRKHKFDRIANIMAYQTRYDYDAKIFESISIALGMPVVPKTKEELKEKDEMIESVATCPEDEGVLPVWCEKDL